MSFQDTPRTEHSRWQCGSGSYMDYRVGEALEKELAAAIKERDAARAQLAQAIKAINDLKIIVNADVDTPCADADRFIDKILDLFFNSMKTP